MAALITAIGDVATALFGHVGTVLGMVSTEPVLQIGLGIFVVGASVGLVTRIIRAF